MSLSERLEPAMQEFIEHIKDNLTDFLPEGISENATVSIQEVVKGNDQKLIGVAIHEPDRNVSPTIYIDSMMDEYKDGTPIDVLMGRIVDIYMEHRNPNQLNFDVSQITDYENIKDMLVTKAINKDLSSEFLETVPHKEFGDLAIICQIRLNEFEGNVASITVRDDLLRQWGKDFDEVMDVAVGNDLMVTEPKLVPMQAIMSSLMFGEEYEQDSFLPTNEEQGMPMFVLQTSDKINGAKLLNQPELMEQVAEFFDSDFIVLPSSIHEAIIIPQGENAFSLSELGQMVRDVNGSEVNPDEVLSDHAYVYSKEEKALTFEKDGETITMKFTKEAKKQLEEPKKEGIKAKLKAGIEKSKEMDTKPKVPKKEQEVSLA